MKATQIVQLAGLHGGETAKRAEAVATQLRQIGLLPKGGRGPHAPEINAVEAANYLLCAAASGRALRIEDVSGLVTGLLELVDEDRTPLLKYLGAFLSSPNLAQTIGVVRVFPHMPMVEIDQRDRTSPPKRFFLPALWEAPHFKPDAQAQAYVGPVGHIGGAVLEQAALQMTEADDEMGEIVPE